VSLHSARDEVHEINVAIAGVLGKCLANADCGATWLGRGRYLGEHSYCSHREFSHRRFFGKHHAVCAVQDGVGDIVDSARVGRWRYTIDSSICVP